MIGTNPQDGDSDDDGVLDGAEANYALDTDRDGQINALDPDSDGDGVLDGTEVGLTTAGADTDVTRGNFVPDADPATTTSPVDPDTDRGGVPDGVEDTDHDGQIDAGRAQTPNDRTDDQRSTELDADGDGVVGRHRQLPEQQQRGAGRSRRRWTGRRV
jgi:clumping factor A